MWKDRPLEIVVNHPVPQPLSMLGGGLFVNLIENCDAKEVLKTFIKLVCLEGRGISPPETEGLESQAVIEVKYAIGY